MNPDLIGRQIGSYRIVSLLGAGAMGEARQSAVTSRQSSVPHRLTPDDRRLTTTSPCR